MLANYVCRPEILLRAHSRLYSRSCRSSRSSNPSKFLLSAAAPSSPLIKHTLHCNSISVGIQIYYIPWIVATLCALLLLSIKHHCSLLGPFHQSLIAHPLKHFKYRCCLGLVCLLLLFYALILLPNSITLSQSLFIANSLSFSPHHIVVSCSVNQDSSDTQVVLTSTSLKQHKCTAAAPTSQHTNLSFSFFHPVVILTAHKFVIMQRRASQ